MGIQGEVGSRMENLSRQGGSIMLDLENDTGIFLRGFYSGQMKAVLVQTVHVNVNHSFVLGISLHSKSLEGRNLS